MEQRFPPANQTLADKVSREETGDENDEQRHDGANTGNVEADERARLPCVRQQHD